MSNSLFLELKRLRIPLVSCYKHINIKTTPTKLMQPGDQLKDTIQAIAGQG